MSAPANSTVMGNEEATGSPERVKILVVDDQPDNLLSAEAVLESLGEEIVTASSGREALLHLLDSDFGVILLDVMMPGMDGFETATLIRQRERSRYTPIIFLTALGKTEEHLFHGYDVGAVDYLFKPIVPAVLRSKVAVFVELSRKSTQVRRSAEALAARNAELENALAQVRKAEREIQALNGHLERRIQELSAVNRELEAFSYSVSHDLRAPLNRIAGFSRAISEMYSGKLDEKGSLYLERIRNASERMCVLVDDLLNLARLTRAEMHHQPVNLSAIVEAITAELEAREPQRRVTFTIAPDVVVDGDEALLRVALVNLLENAWKFTRNHASALIEFGVQREGRSAVYFVRDDGAGFDMASSGRLFTAFERLHAASDFEGTGIGLATVARIVLRHGGQVWAKGGVEQGATFYFTLPERDETAG